MKVNGKAVYGTTASPFKKLDWGRCTQQPGKLFLHVFDWPKDGKLVVPLAGRVKKAYLLAQPRAALALTAAESGPVTVTVPAIAPDNIATVVVLEIDGPPQAL